jgi:hypothetical protein
MNDDDWAFIDMVGAAWEQSGLRAGQQPVYRYRWTEDDAFFEYATPDGDRNTSHYHIFGRGRNHRCRYQLTCERRHNNAANGDPLYEGNFNGQRFTVNDWVNNFANGLDRCMRGDLNANFNGGGKKGKRSLKNRSKRSATHRKKKHATKRR